MNAKDAERQIAEFKRVAFGNGEPFEAHGHAAQPCAREGCDAEAAYFLCPEHGQPTAEAQHENEYLCADCCAKLFASLTGEDEDDFEWEPIEHADGVRYEFAGYCCHEDCDECGN